jgi:hypothetical protein
MHLLPTVTLSCLCVRKHDNSNPPMLVKTRHRIKYLALFILLIHISNSVRNHTYLHCCALLTHAESPWTLSCQAFNQLYYVLFLDVQMQRTGRPQLMHPAAQLGLYLFFIGSTMGNKHLCLIFGITPTVCSRVINKMMIWGVQKLKRHPFAQVKFLDEEKMARFARQINEHEPAVNDVIGFMDGLALQSECTSEQIEQNAMYSGYHSDTMVNNIFAYGPDGNVFLATINFPGSWHDGSITANILPYIGNNIGTYNMCVDQGFP